MTINNALFRKSFYCIRYIACFEDFRKFKNSKITKIPKLSRVLKFLLQSFRNVGVKSKSKSNPTFGEEKKNVVLGDSAKRLLIFCPIISKEICVVSCLSRLSLLLLPPLPLLLYPHFRIPASYSTVSSVYCKFCRSFLMFVICFLLLFACA